VFKLHLSANYDRGHVLIDHLINLDNCSDSCINGCSDKALATMFAALMTDGWMDGWRLIIKSLQQSKGTVYRNSIGYKQPL